MIYTMIRYIKNRNDEAAKAARNRKG